MKSLMFLRVGMI